MKKHNKTKTNLPNRNSRLTQHRKEKTETNYKAF